MHENGEAKKTFCSTLQEGRAVRVPIAVGLEVGDEAEVASGLKGDELVVRAGGDALREGESVELAPPAGSIPAR